MSRQLHTGPWARFSARFDSVLLSAPLPDVAALPPTELADTQVLLHALQGLCAPGVPGFAMARQTLAPAPAARAAQQACLTHQMLALDGTLHMQQLGGVWRQRLHRLAVKLQEGLRSGPSTPGLSTPGLPWDCGWLNTTAAAQAQAVHFMPRRPTLILAWQLPPATLQLLQAALQARSSAYTLPVRLWVLEAPSVGASAATSAGPEPL